MGVETALMMGAIGSLISAGVSTAGTIDTHNNTKKQRTQQRNARAEVEQTKIAKENKQKELQDTYKNMKTNLYSGDINGIKSNNGNIYIIL